MRKDKQSSAGFSLLEVMIMLVVLSTMAAGTFSFLAVEARKKNIEITNAKLDVIEDALIVYLAKNGRIPCPASPWQISSNATFGAERRGGTSCEFSASSSITNTSGRHLGTVPTRTLGLSDEYMFDAWGNRLGYVVQRPYINNEVINPLCTSDGKTASTASNNSTLCFRGRSEAASTLIARNIQGGQVGRPLYVLISYGENGNGAFLRGADVDVDGGQTSTTSAYRNPAPTDANELKNGGYAIDGTWSLSSMQNTFISGPQSQVFDDIIRFKTRNVMVLECNLYGGNNICTTGRGIYAR